MDVIKPDYYDSFQCAAGKCPFTCCRDWSIPVDSAAERKWNRLSLPDTTGKAFMPLSSVICSREGERVIRLNKSGFCPLLKPDGLCSAVCTYGEQVLSATCHTYPREAHHFRGRTEYSLALGCPAALDLLFKSNSFHLTCDTDSECMASDMAENSMFALRDRLIRLIQEPEYTPETAFKMVFWYLADLKGKGPNLPENYLKDAFSASFLHELSAGVLNVHNSPDNIISEQNSLFLALAERYLNKNMYIEALKPLAAHAERLESDEDMRRKTVSAKSSFESVWNQSEHLLRCLIAEELYTGLYMPGADTCGLMLKAEWTGMFYGILKHCSFLRFSDTGLFTKEDLKELVCLLVRMTGYCDAEITEYLKDSYTDPYWSWSYFSLIIS